MSRIRKPDRRGFLKGGLSLGTLSLLTGCDLTDNEPAQRLLWNMSYWNDWVQGWLFDPNRLAPTYPESAVDRVFRYNAFYPEEQAPQLDPAIYRLELSGAIGDKRSWTVDNLYQLPRTSQITRHVCVEGWSRIGKWSGCPLRIFLERVEADLTKNYVGFICADGYYTSIDMPTALHPQTIMAFTFADQILPRKFGYPMKIRIPTKLGFKNPKFVVALSVTNDYPGGFWEMTGTIGSAAPKGVLRPVGGAVVSEELCAVAIMAKASLAGSVKTRLVPPLSYEEAAELNTCCLADVAANLAAASARAPIHAFAAYHPLGSERFFDDLLPDNFKLLAPKEPTIGRSLFHAARDLFAAGYGSVCLINADSPTLPTDLLVEAVRCLQEPGDRVVLGPAADGGYYLIGLKRFHQRLFEAIDWSTERVYRQTRMRAAEIGVPVAPLAEWYDVDDEASLAVLARDLLSAPDVKADHNGSYAAPRTTAFLAQLAAKNGGLRHLFDAPPVVLRVM